MSQITQLPPSTLTQAYPNLTATNHNELATLLERLQMTPLDHGYCPDSA
jgi:hypothetical protein